MFSKLWNAIEIDLKVTKSEKYERFKCEKPSCISCE